MKKTSILLVGILFATIACKKSTTPTSTGSPTNTTQNTTISNGFGAAGTSSINGVFIAETYDVLIQGLSILQYHSRASLFKTVHPFNQLYFLTGVIAPGDSAGHLKLNTTTMVRDTGNSPFIYTDTLSAANYSGGVTWNLTGNTYFTGFSALISRNFPTITNANYIPTTFSKTQNLTLNFNSAGYGNTDSLLIMIQTSSSTAAASAYKYVAGNASSVTFTAADMSSLIPGASFSQVEVCAKNFSNMSVGGKNYIFAMHYNVLQFVTVTP